MDPDLSVWAVGCRLLLPHSCVTLDGYLPTRRLMDQARAWDWSPGWRHRDGEDGSPRRAGVHLQLEHSGSGSVACLE